MTTKVLLQPWLWKRFTGAALDIYLGAEGEMVIDMRYQTPSLRLCDGVTPGGHPVVAAGFNFDGLLTFSPRIVSPEASGEVNAPLMVMSSPAEGLSDLHIASYWEFAFDPQFTDVVYRSGRSAEYLTAIDFAEVGVVLPTGSTYYVRVQYQYESGMTSAWSDRCQFTVVSSLPETQQVKLLAADGAFSDNLGRSASLSADGTIAVLGAYGNDDLGSNVGSLYVFYRGTGTWEQQELLLSPGALQGDGLGFAACISGDGLTIVGGANGALGGGKVCVFAREGTTWVEQATLVGHDTVTGDSFGSALAINHTGDLLVVGAQGVDGLYPNEGAVYVFQRTGTTWTQVTQLYPDNGLENDYFGSAVAISSDGSTIAVGSYGRDDFGSACGGVYIYRLLNGVWVLDDELYALDAEAGDNLGQSLALSADGTVLLVGACREDQLGSNAGAAYVFQYEAGEWKETVKLVANDGLTNDYFGYDVALSANGEVALIGAYGIDGTVSNQGGAYVYRREADGWQFHSKLLAGDALASDQLGWKVSLSADGTTALVATPFNDQLARDAGAGYIFA